MFADSIKMCLKWSKHFAEDRSVEICSKSTFFVSFLFTNNLNRNNITYIILLNVVLFQCFILIYRNVYRYWYLLSVVLFLALCVSSIYLIALFTFDNLNLLCVLCNKQILTLPLSAFTYYRKFHKFEF